MRVRIFQSAELENLDGRLIYCSIDEFLATFGPCCGYTRVP